MYNKEQSKIKNIFMILFIIILVLISWLTFKSHNIPKSLNQVFPLLDSSFDNEVDPFIYSKIIELPSNIYPKSGYSIIIINKDNLLAFWGIPDNKKKYNNLKEINNIEFLQSRFENNKWGKPELILSINKLSTFNQKYIRDLQEHIVYQDNNGVIHLFIISNNIIDLAGNNITHLISTNNGKDWFLAEKSLPSLFFSKNQFSYSNIINLKDGFYLPINNVFLFKYIPKYFEKSRLLHFNQNNEFIEEYIAPSSLSFPKFFNEFLFKYTPKYYEKSDLLHFNQNNEFIEEYLVPSSLGKATFFNSPVAMIQLESNLQFIVYNSNNDKSKLGIAKSIDGIHWHNIKVLEDKRGDTFTNPYIQIKDKNINLLYIWNYKFIKHLRFNKEWLIDEKI